jgi:hypothetical protein
MTLVRPIISLKSINKLIYVMENCCALSAVQTEILTTI